MARTLGAAIRKAIFAPQTDEAVIVLLTLTHADLASPIRVSSNAVATVRGGQTFVAFPFRIDIPDEPEDAPPRARLEIDNVDRSILQAIETIQGDALDVEIVVVPASDPDDTIAGPYHLSLEDVEGDALTVTGSLSFEPILSEPFPGDLFTPSQFPGAF